MLFSELQNLTFNYDMWKIIFVCMANFVEAEVTPTLSLCVIEFLKRQGNCFLMRNKLVFLLFFGIWRV